jgi:hypothetical protein
MWTCAGVVTALGNYIAEHNVWQHLLFITQDEFSDISYNEAPNIPSS